MNGTDYPLALSDQLVCRMVDDDFLILDIDNQNVHELNVTAAFIWQHCDGNNTIESIAALFSKAFEISLEAARRDVDTVVTDLLQKALVQIKSAPRDQQ